MALLNVSPPRIIQAVAIQAPPYLLSAVRVVISEVAYTDSMRMHLYPPHCTLTDLQQSAKMMFLAPCFVSRHTASPSFSKAWPPPSAISFRPCSLNGYLKLCSCIALLSESYIKPSKQARAAECDAEAFHDSIAAC